MPVKKRKRGGQPGNQNARKHGFYSSRMNRKETRDLNLALNRGDVEKEIAALRVKLAAALHIAPGNRRIQDDASRQLSKYFRHRQNMSKEDYAVLKKFVRLATGKAAGNFSKTNKAKTT